MEDLKKKMNDTYTSWFSQGERTEKHCRYFMECVESVCQKNRQDWDAIINNEHSFFANRNARIGENYGVPGNPKIVFIGKESRCRSSEAKAPEDFEKQKNQHYRRTRATLAALLGITEEINKNNPETYSFWHPVNNREYPLHTVFALTNHYHCAFKKTARVHGVPTTDLMWHNCTDIVKAELEVLKPDILVIQAGWSTKQYAEKYISEYFSDSFNVVPDDPNCGGLYWLENKHNHARVCCIIGSYHPSFHCWHEEKYLKPFNERVKKAKTWFESKTGI